MNDVILIQLLEAFKSSFQELIRLVTLTSHQPFEVVVSSGNKGHVL